MATVLYWLVATQWTTPGRASLPWTPPAGTVYPLTTLYPSSTLYPQG